MANSKLEALETIAEQLMADILQAWPDVERANILSDHQENESLPRVSIEISVENEQRSVRTLSQHHQIRINRLWQFQRGARLLTDKLEKANALIELLMLTPVYAGEADSVFVPRVDLNPLDLEHDRRTEAAISIYFSCDAEQFTTDEV